MTRERDSRASVVDALVGDLVPVARPGRTRIAATAWLGLTFVVAAGLMLWHAPFRAGFAADLASHPRYALESLLGIAAIAAVTFAAFRSTIPGSGTTLATVWVPSVLVFGWIGFYGYGLVDPALAPSMAGKRPHCLFEVPMYGAPALVLGLVALKRYYPMTPARTGALIGLAAGAVPALLMQAACMYVVPHIFAFHLLPALVVAGAGALIGAIVLKPA